MNVFRMVNENSPTVEFLLINKRDTIRSLQLFVLLKLYKKEINQLGKKIKTEMFRILKSFEVSHSGIRVLTVVYCSYMVYSIEMGMGL